MQLLNVRVETVKTGLARFGKGRPSLYTFTHPCKRPGRVILLAASVAILFSTGTGSAWADNECGEGEQSGAITKITCDPGNYEPSEDGNIVYVLGHDDDHERRYTISIKNLLGERGITLNDDLDFPHAYNSFQPSAVWISYAGSSDLDVGISGIDLKTGFTEETATSTNNNNSLSDHGGINVWMVNDPPGTLPYATPRDLSLTVRDSVIHTYSRAITGANFWDGAINIDVRDSRIHTYGPLGIGVYAYHPAIGDIDINVENVDIVIAQEEEAIAGTVHDRFREDPDRYSGPATIRITVKDSRIKIAGGNSTGLYGSHHGSGEVVVGLDHSSIEASDGASGIWVQHSTDTVQAENLNTIINVENSEIVTTDGDGIVIARSPGSTGTNMVAIGSSSSVRAGGDGYGVTTRGNTVVVIKGLVSAENGKAIVNRDGTLTLHIQDSGQIDGSVTYDADHDFDMWVGNEQLVDNGEIIQRTGATGAFDTTVAMSNSVSLSREFGARAAVYEALASALMRLGGHGRSVAAPVRSAESPLWISAARARGSYEPERSTVGIEYDFSRYELEAGWDVSFGDIATGSVSVRHISGSADVSSPVKGGQIDVTGYGLAAGLAWRGAGGVYAEGRLSPIWFDIDLASDVRGTLKTSADAFSHAIDLEGGQRLAVGRNTALTLRTWLSRSDLLMDEFTDAVGARVSVKNSEIVKGGFGGVITTGPDRNAPEEELSLRVSAGMEHTLSGWEQTVSVSGEELTSRGNVNRLLLGLGLTKRWRRSTLGAGLRAAGPGSEDYEYAGNVSLNIPF